MRPLNLALLQVSRRAERSTSSQLLASFVDVGDLSATVQGHDHQVMYGRRGTGKTHVLSILANRALERGDMAVQIDLRTLGSTGGIYSDYSLPLAERGTRLLTDLLWAFHDAILEAALDDETVDLAAVQVRLDALAAAVSDVRVVGQASQSISENGSTTASASAGLGVGGTVPLSAQVGFSDSVTSSRATVATVTGEIRHRIHFGAVSRCLTELFSALRNRRVWLLLDEWSEIPLDLQPYLSDLLRRSVFPVRAITVKVAAIEQRTNFRRVLDDGSDIGIEIGADGAPSLTLDDFMVFDNDAQVATAFFRRLLWKHVVTSETQSVALDMSEDEFASEAFTQVNVLQELARAAEGVPRDALNIAAVAARMAGDRKISVADVRAAARQWYQQSKEAAVSSRQRASELLHWIVSRVIGERRARAFLLPTGTRNELIDYLYDSRVLHVIKKSVSSNDTPGIRYNVYAIDYGCYVDLISTANAPLGLLETESDTGDIVFADVPVTDYRSIRRAILDIDAFVAGS